MDQTRRNTIKGFTLAAVVGAFGFNLNASELKERGLLFISSKTKNFSSSGYDTVSKINLLCDFANSKKLIQKGLEKFDRAVGVLDTANFVILNELNQGYKISSTKINNNIIFKIEKDKTWQNI